MLSVTDGMFVFPQNAYVEILTHSVMVVRSGAFRRISGPKGGAFINEISALIKETPRELSFLLLRERIQASSLQTRGKPQ